MKPCSKATRIYISHIFRKLLVVESCRRVRSRRRRLVSRFKTGGIPKRQLHGWQHNWLHQVILQFLANHGSSMSSQGRTSLHSIVDKHRKWIVATREAESGVSSGSCMVAFCGGQHDAFIICENPLGLSGKVADAISHFRRRLQLPYFGNHVYRYRGKALRPAMDISQQFLSRFSEISQSFLGNFMKFLNELSAICLKLLSAIVASNRHSSTNRTTAHKSLTSPLRRGTTRFQEIKTRFTSEVCLCLNLFVRNRKFQRTSRDGRGCPPQSSGDSRGPGNLASRRGMRSFFQM